MSEHMSLIGAFRLSFYLTLAFAACCLAVGESLFLPWMMYALPAILALIVLAYCAEGRWQLSLQASNIIGLFVAGGVAAWGYYFMPRDEKDFIEIGLPWPAGMLPYLGPLLLILLVLKLFRAKTSKDFWALQAIGLIIVALGCILTADTLFGLLLAAYTASVIWCLALYYLVRQQQTAKARQAPVRGRLLFGASAFSSSAQTDRHDGSDAVTTGLFEGSAISHRIPWRRWGLDQVTRWSLCIIVLGFCLFMLAPRQSNNSWQPDSLSNGELPVGIGIENNIDLSRTGTAQLSDEVAFAVSAQSKLGPVNYLSPSTRWFVDFLEYYDRGRWLNADLAQHKAKRGYEVNFLVGYPSSSKDKKSAKRRSTPDSLPDDHFNLRFRVSLALEKTKPLLYPTEDDGDLGLNARVNEEPSRQPFFMRLKGRDIICTFPERKSGFFLPRGETVVRVPVRAPVLSEGSVFTYSQIVRARSEPEFFPVRSFDASHADFLVKQETPDAIVQWTRALLPRLWGLTPQECRLDEKGHVALAHRARVASALCEYLSLSGDYRYSLMLRRQDKGDPTVDFLLNVKEGHCTRFAGGLALMLRSVGIPSRIVMGFRGAEGGDNGEYVVRMRHAHSWVQALVKVPDSDVWHWQTLDPTPPAAARYAQGPLSLFGPNGLDLPQLWHNYVLDLTADRQAQSQRAVLATLTSVWFWLVVAGSVSAFIALRRLRPLWRKSRESSRRNGKVADSPTPEHDLSWYQSFLEALAKKFQLQPARGQTPREFGRLAAEHLERHTPLNGLAKIPSQLVDLLYDLRFGGRQLTPGDLAVATTAVAELESASVAASHCPGKSAAGA